MQLNITNLIEDFQSEEISPIDFSASRAELGNNAAEITWENAENHILDTREEVGSLYSEVANDRSIFIDYFLEFGAWGSDELQDMASYELAALVLQMIAGDYRELENTDFDFENCSGRLYECESDNNWYYYVGM